MKQNCFLNKKEGRQYLRFLFGVILLFGVTGGSAFANPSFDGSVPSYSWEKNLFENSDYAQGYPPNILFLIDTSGSMLKDANGTWTYGDGSRPWRDHINSRYWEYYWGSDTNSDNNDPLDSSCYHPLLIRKGSDASPWGNPNDLIPNDSRLYILRNVMYQLLGKPDLMFGINIAIGTYYQRFGPTEGDWYYFRGSPQDIYWNGYGKGMRLRAPLTSALNVETGEVQPNLVALFDGNFEESQEIVLNDEMRGDGGTPLAASIYPERGQTGTSAFDFFRDMNGDFDGYCQANWLIVMTDGDDTDSSRTPHSAVEKLYQDTKNFRDKDGELMEYPVRTMVIGFIDSADNPELRDELDLCADIGFDGVENGIPAHAYYADNFDDLFAAFEDILTTIKEMSGSGGTPVTRPGIPGSEGFVYIPGREYHENALWTGTLKKYNINFLGEMKDEVVWEASSKIIPSSRTVLTANWHGGGSRYPGTNLTAFDAANWQAVAQELGIRYALSDATLIDEDAPEIGTQTKCFIRWYRGETPSTPGESCSNWLPRESPLADMERSGLLVVGPPQALWGDEKYIDFRDEHDERDECVYIQSSEGMLHCFDVDSGEERWAFIPPQALRWARIAGLRAERQMDEGEPSFWRWSWYGNDPQKAERAVPREILGGPLTVEDVLMGTGDNARYGTVLLGCLGYGGYGMYALEITDPAKPQFLWAVENAAAVNPETGQLNPFLPDEEESYPIQALLHWAGEKEGSATAQLRYCPTLEGLFDEETKRYYAASDDAPSCSNAYLTERSMEHYGDLAFTLSTPFMGRLRLKPGDTPRSVGFIGGGLRERLEADPAARGCVIYLFGLEDGRIYAAWGKGITTEYSPSAPYFGEKVASMGMVYAPISPMISAGGDTVRRIYAPDSDGYIHCIKFYDDAAKEELAMDKWEHEIPVYLTDSSPVAIPYQMPIGSIGDAVWLFGGTKDVITPSGNLTNDNQYVFGIKVSAFCDGAGCGLDCTDTPIAMENLKVLGMDDGDEVLVIDNSSCGYEEDESKKYWGWKIVLGDGEYVSASPALSDMFGRLFVATFVPDDVVDRCVAESGNAKLFVLNAQNGASDWLEGTDEKYVEFQNVRIGGISVYDSFRNEEPGTQVILTFQKGTGGGENLRETLEDAGAQDVLVGDEVASFFLGLKEARAGELGIIHFDETALRFWKNSK